MRDNYLENKRIPLGAMVTTGSARAGHERMAGKHLRNSSGFLGAAAAIAVFPPSATDRVAGHRACRVSDRDAHWRHLMHPDIQPATVTRAVQSDTVEVTDFGITPNSNARRSVDEPVAQAQG